MAAPDFYDRTLEPPTPGMSEDEMFRWLYDIWQRTGGFENIIPDLSGLEASVEELNTLVGINTATTVQAQLNLKANSSALGTIASQNANNVNITGGALSSVIISGSTVSGDLRVNIGTSGNVAKCSASLNSNVTSTSNTGAPEETLMSYTLPANSLGTNGDYIDIECFGTFAANGNNKRLRLYFGSTTIYDSGVVAANAGSWLIKAKVAREALADQVAIASVVTSNALVTPTTSLTDPSEALGSGVLIKLTSTATAATDLTQRGMMVKWFADA